MQVVSARAAPGLNRNSLADRRDPAGQQQGVDAGQFAVVDRGLESFGQSVHRRVAELGQSRRLPDRQATVDVAADRVGRTVDHRLGDRAGRRPGQRFHRVRARAGEVALQGAVEQVLLGLELGVDAPTVHAGRGGHIGDGHAVEAAFPEQSHRHVLDLSRVELPGPPDGHRPTTSHVMPVTSGMC